MHVCDTGLHFWGHSHLFLADETLLDEVYGNLHGSPPPTLPVSGLEHEKFSLLDREFNVLHVSVVLRERES
jgi:hypothetical protein